MKKSNVLGLIGAILGIAILISLITWFVVDDKSVLLQGEAEATSYKASSKVAGRVEQMFVTEGQQVKKGDILYILSIPEVEAKVRQAQAAETAAEVQSRKANAGARSQEITAVQSLYNQAQAALDLASKSYDRVKNLYEQGVLPAQKYDEALANYNAAQAAATAARAQYDLAREGARSEDKAAAAALVDQAAGVVSEAESLASDSYVYSPVDGEVSSIIAEVGELVGQGFPVVTVIDMNDMWVEYNVKETLLPKIQKGRIVSAYIPALDRNVDFVVDYISVQADFATWSATKTQGTFDIKTFTVKTRLVDKIEGLRPGMSALIDWDNL